MKLNLGCGPQVLDGWVNVDYALGARLMKLPLLRAVNRKLRVFNVDWDERIFVHDLTKPFPWSSGSADVVYSSHTLEHLSKEDGRRFLSECHRVLRDDGVIRIVVPDLRSLIDDYTQGQIKADDFVQRLDVLYQDSGSSIKRKLAPFIQFPHKCMYDNQRMVEVLESMGFEARVRKAFDSEIEDIRRVEDGGRTERAVIVEGRKRSANKLS